MRTRFETVFVNSPEDLAVMRDRLVRVNTELSTTRQQLWNSEDDAKHLRNRNATLESHTLGLEDARDSAVTQITNCLQQLQQQIEKTEEDSRKDRESANLKIAELSANQMPTPQLISTLPPHELHSLEARLAGLQDCVADTLRHTAYGRTSPHTRAPPNSPHPCHSFYGM
eukprot:NODE_2471_length_690_cov_68.962559_g2019_i0.p1 GENE.NODE_2471_length_690_cov_68.962559_g2019_i0~~NODE_2471_length_690_cov_68.962559_g2019_i0.p1  ORF type:complete len:170 (-),score=26.07 NODE_2471_length_690_cov_68.962559_g2019_i0:58-567(-)